MLYLDKGIYCKEAVVKAAFLLTDRFYFHISQDENSWIVSCEAKDSSADNEKEYENEVIHQETQIELLKSSKTIRELVLARALASTILQAENDEGNQAASITPADDEFDQEEIMKGWFEQSEHSQL